MHSFSYSPSDIRRYERFYFSPETNRKLFECLLVEKIISLMEHYDEVAGMCNIFTKDLIEYIDLVYHGEFYIRSFHGEIRRPGLPKYYNVVWEDYQHTLLYVKHHATGDEWWIDGTCGQFKELIPDIADIYISPEQPEWFLTDDENPRFNCYHRLPPGKDFSDGS